MVLSNIFQGGGVGGGVRMTKEGGPVEPFTDDNEVAYINFQTKEFSFHV